MKQMLIKSERFPNPFLLKLAMCFTGIISEREKLWGSSVSSFENKYWHLIQESGKREKHKRGPKGFLASCDTSHTGFVHWYWQDVLCHLCFSQMPTPPVNVQPFMI